MAEIGISMEPPKKGMIEGLLHLRSGKENGIRI